MQNHDHPAGPQNGLFGLKALMDFNKDHLEFITNAARDYDDVVYHRFGPYHCYMINHPDLIREVLVTKNKHFYKWSRIKGTMGKVGGEGILLADGDDWRYKRKLVQPAFHAMRIREYGETMAHYTKEMLNRWQEGEIIDIEEEMVHLTMRIISKSIFDVDFVEDTTGLDEAVTISQEMIVNDSTHLLHIPDWIPTPRNRRESHALNHIQDFIMKIIRDRRETGEDHGDLLSALLMAEDEDGSGLTDEQVYDEAVTLFIAGHETTAHGLGWMWYLTTQNPYIMQKLHEEAQTVLAENDAGFDNLSELEYTEKVFKESMRIYPPIWMFHREVVEQVEIGGYTLPEESVVYVTPWTIHHDERFWEDPLKFEPERFDPSHKEDLVNYAYFPFGGGPRVCVGNHFAMMEAKIIAATIAKEWHFDLVENQEIIPETLVTLRAKNGIKVYPRKY